MSLRRAVQALSGQNVSRCQACLDCDVNVHEGMDIPLSSVVQLILQDDEEVLGCSTVWSNLTLEQAGNACLRGLDLRAVILSLRRITPRGGLMP